MSKYTVDNPARQFEGLAVILLVFDPDTHAMGVGYESHDGRDGG